MKLLHTADVHLTPAAPERFDAFERVCRVARDLGCAALLVAGDLFDSPSAAAEMRPQVRELFDSLETEVLLIPGNHDAAACGSGEYYGRMVRLAAGGSPMVWDVGNVPVVGLPYAPGRASCEYLRTLPIKQIDAPLVVLAHADFYNSALATLYFQEKEGSGAGFFWDRDFEEFPLAYIALGHWHNPTLPPVKVNRVQVAYSGTPYPLAKGETGPRKVFLVTVSQTDVGVEALDIPGVPRRETASFFFVPGSEEQTLEEIRTYLCERADPLVMIDLEVNGWIGDAREEVYTKEINALAVRYRDGWKAVNPGTPRFLSAGALSGTAGRCLQLLRELDPPDFFEVDEFCGPPLKQLAREVLSDRESLYREAMTVLLRHLGRGGTVADS